MKAKFENEIVKQFMESKGSDIHISTNNTIGFRVKGILEKKDVWGVFSADDTIQMYDVLKSYLPPDLQEFVESTIKKQKHTGFAITVATAENDYRFRVNAAYNNSGYYIVMRIIDSTPPDLDKLGFNQNTMDALTFATKRRAGLFLVVGATGSGKSTTLASMIKMVNTDHQKNIITLEDPIEFEHESLNCQVVQKEKGRDFEEFEEGLHSALREDPDVILIGEIRDETTLDLCLEASETGHLVFGTLHTQDAIGTIQRLAAMSDNVELTRERLSKVMIGAIAQTLTLDVNKNRICIWEVLINDKASAALISESKDTQLKGLLDTKDKCQSFNKTIRDYYGRGIIDEETAFMCSPDPKYLELDTIEREGGNSKSKELEGLSSNKKTEEEKIKEFREEEKRVENLDFNSDDSNQDDSNEDKSNTSEVPSKKNSSFTF